MILESKVGGKIVLVDCEASGGISKGDVGGEYDPDRVLASSNELIHNIASNLASVATAPGVATAEVVFGIKMVNSGLVYVSTTPQNGQLQVKLTLKTA